jgi:hypothetical protein
MEVFLIFCEILRRERIKGVCDDETMLLMGFCGVLRVNGGLMAEGCAIGEVVNDEAFHQLSFREIPVESIHLSLIDPAEALQFALFVTAVGNRPFIF